MPILYIIDFRNHISANAPLQAWYLSYLWERYSPKLIEPVNYIQVGTIDQMKSLLLEFSCNISLFRNSLLCFYNTKMTKCKGISCRIAYVLQTKVATWHQLQVVEVY